MSLTFVSEIDDETPLEIINSLCRKIWNTKKETAIKLFFFIGDHHQGKNQPIAFQNIMVWLYFNHLDYFYKNYSLTVGVPNSQTLPSSVSNKMLKKEREELEKALDYFIVEDHKETFRRNWEVTTKEALLKAYGLPRYISWNTFIGICEKIRQCLHTTMEEFQKEKVFLTTINIITNQFKKTKSLDILEALQNHNIYLEYIKQNKLMVIPEKENLEKENPEKENKGKVNPEKAKKTFLERYMFVR
jgi:hypothetical protein